MALSSEDFKEWLDKDLNYLHSDQIPVEAIFSK